MLGVLVLIFVNCAKGLQRRVVAWARAGIFRTGCPEKGISERISGLTGRELAIFAFWRWSFRKYRTERQVFAEGRGGEFRGICREWRGGRTGRYCPFPASSDGCGRVGQTQRRGGAEDAGSRQPDEKSRKTQDRER